MRAFPLDPQKIPEPTHFLNLNLETLLAIFPLPSYGNTNKALRVYYGLIEEHLRYIVHTRYKTGYTRYHLFYYALETAGMEEFIEQVL